MVAYCKFARPPRLTDSPSDLSHSFDGGDSFKPSDGNHQTLDALHSNRNCTDSTPSIPQPRLQFLSYHSYDVTMCLLVCVS